MPKVRSDCIRVPANKTPSDYVPLNSVKRSVTDGESFLSIANDLGISPAWKLIWYNFPTVGESFSERGAAEVNWYLESTLGCSAVTADGKNYKFHTGMRRPYIYVPIEFIEMPGAEVTVPRPRPAPPPPPEPSLFWYGGGLKQSQPTGGVILPSVQESVTGMLFSDDDSRWFAMSATGTRTGINISIGAASAVALLATGVRDPMQLQNFKLSGIDFSVQLGPAAKGVGQALRNPKALATLGKLGSKILITAAEKEELRNAIKSALDAYGVDKKSTTPRFHVIEIPFLGVGVEVALYYLDSRLKVDVVGGG